MNFESYEKHSRIGSITTQGAIRLSRGVADFLKNNFDLDRPLFADLKFEKSLNLLGIGVSTQKIDLSGHICSKMFLIESKGRLNGISVSARSALKHFEIDFSKSSSYPCEWNQELGLLVIDLNAKDC